MFAHVKADQYGTRCTAIYKTYFDNQLTPDCMAEELAPGGRPPRSSCHDLSQDQKIRWSGELDRCAGRCPWRPKAAAVVSGFANAVEKALSHPQAPLALTPAIPLGLCVCLYMRQTQAQHERIPRI